MCRGNVASNKPATMWLDSKLEKSPLRELIHRFRNVKMSIVTVQLGQCGNQVGHELFEAISHDALQDHRKSFSTASRERFFNQTARGGESPAEPWVVCSAPAYLCKRFRLPDLVARAVLVDMEPKVIKQSISKANSSGRWRYGETSHFFQNQGSGNNWANG